MSGKAPAAADVLTLPRLMRGLQHRAETPNADRDPIRYQWHTRPFADDPAGGVGRLNSEDILEAVRRRIRSPPDRQIRDRMQRRRAGPAGGGGGGGAGGGEVNSVMAHYLAASSLADSVLNRRLVQPPPAGCRCCADVNFVNKMRRHRAARGVVPLPEQDRLMGPSRYHYHESPDEQLLLLDDHRRLLRSRGAPAEQLLRSEAEHRLDANLRRLENSIQALGEPPELPSVPDGCSVWDELEPGAGEYFRPGVVPTKYLPFAPRNPLRHPPPQLDAEAYRDRRKPGRAKYVSFSPRNPELVVYSPEGSML